MSSHLANDERSRWKLSDERVAELRERADKLFSTLNVHECIALRDMLSDELRPLDVDGFPAETTENPVAWCVEASHDGSLSPPTSLRMDAATHQETMRQVHPGITWTLVPLYRRAVKTSSPRCEKHGVELAFDGDGCWECSKEER